ncbi:MAG: AIR synthase related protein, partial [Gemmatimonadaceae bacterium]
MTLETSLGAGAEFDIIRELVARWGTRAHGIGDDAATFAPTRGESVVVSVDAAVEGRHFKAAWLSPREIGYRAVAAALSDLAAMA